MGSNVKWLELPHPAIAVSGLPWHEENWPRLWRLPRGHMEAVPDRVRQQALFPAGARLRLTATSGQLHLRARSVSASAGQAHGIDLYVDGSFWHTVPVTADKPADICCFEECDWRERRIDLYLPHRREVEIAALGLDADGRLGTAPAATRPIVLYGSSVAQGAGASRPGMGYGSILCRRLEVDLVNLGFGGAGKAEPEVVDLVTQVEASCFLLDLGKSYGLQDATAYTDMLSRLRETQPDAPIICLTPIYSSREAHSPEYGDLSRHTRDVVTQAYESVSQDDGVVLVDGLELLGPDDADGLSSDGVHPSDLGFQRLAERLQPLVQTALGGCMS